MASFRRFIYAIECPCVDYFRPDNCPRAKEALITSHGDWQTGIAAYHAAQSRIRCDTFDIRHLELNKHNTSHVWLFSEPDLRTKRIYPLPWNTGELILNAPIFANPRHPNFKQIYIQSYVTSGYFEDRAIAPFLTTFIGRRRRRHELGKSFLLSTEATEGSTIISEITPDQSIPVLVIVTPVNIDNSFYSEIENAGYRAFGELVERLWAKSHPI